MAFTFSKLRFLAFKIENTRNLFKKISILYFEISTLLYRFFILVSLIYISKLKLTFCF